MRKITIILLVLVITVSSCFGPGSYPHAEQYDINISEQELIMVVQSFKESHPIYGKKIQHLNDGKSNGNSHWYTFYFGNKRKDFVMHCVVGSRKEGISTLSLVAIKPYKGFPGWKSINNDLSGSENKRLIKVFETEILYQLGIDSLIVN